VDWRAVGLTFGMLFLAEMGDKTQLTVFTLAARTQAPWSVFFGASAALVLVTLLGALLGDVITKYVPIKYINIAAGLLFLGFGTVILYQTLMG
jgi:putative Ca2+/H+ antiporter (TMEM165/GDT1 family)